MEEILLLNRIDDMDTAINPKDQNHYCGFSQGGGDLLNTEELKSSIGLFVYPNPLKNIFTVQWKNTSKVSFKVFDVTGKQILQYDENSFAKNTVKIDLSKYSKGMYFLKVTLDTIEENTKLIKNYAKQDLVLKQRFIDNYSFMQTLVYK